MTTVRDRDHRADRLWQVDRRVVAGRAGAVVIDADRVARLVTGPGWPAAAEIGATFGRQLVGDDGSLDRAALGRIVFADPAALAALEAIVHPAVRPVILEEMAAAERAGAPAVVVEAIKLVEGGLAELCDEVWLVVCSTEVQLDRLRARVSLPPWRCVRRGSANRRAIGPDCSARVRGDADPRHVR